MTYETRIVSASIDRPADVVYDFACRMENLTKWAAGLASELVQSDGDWFADTPGGRIRIAMAPRNAFRVLDHDVTMADGFTVHNAMRVTPADDGSVVAFVVLRLPGMSDADFERDAGLVAQDLQTLKKLVEALG